MGVAVMGVGAVVFVVGVFLFLGNVAGFFPTVPLAGYLTIVAGGAVFGWGKRMREEQRGGPSE